MIKFRRIELSDKKDIDNILVENIYRTCDLCFANLYAWSVQYNFQFSIIDKTLFVRFFDSLGGVCYMMPIGKMPLIDAFDLIQKDAKINNIFFQMRKITPRMWDAIQNEMPDKFQYILDRDNFDYIYLTDKLISLSGKKLQSKRNHINRFKADNPNWEYYPITNATDIEECLAMHEEWSKQSRDKEQNGYQYDYEATKIMLDNFDYLKLKGGGIRVNGKTIAFTIGEPLTKSTFVIHVEKAFSHINGAYTIINQQFVEHEVSEFTYVNREEDLGIENLRKAKMSYYPEDLLEVGILKAIE